MKYYNVILLPLICFLTLNISTAQIVNFDLNVYSQFLSINNNLTTDQLYKLYGTDSFKTGITSPPSNILYLDSIIAKYNITESEISLLNKNGFVVTERLSHESFGNAIIDIWHKDLPIFISTDAILHALHKSYDKILIDVERTILIRQLDSLLTLLHSTIPALDSIYSQNPAMQQMLRDVDIYLTIPRKLLNTTASPYYAENEATISELNSLIEEEQPKMYKLFSNVDRTIDFSQFKVRGHYTNPDLPQLAKYFKAMIWLGRTEFYLLAPQSVDALAIPIEDIGRQVIDAELILEASRISNASPVLEEINEIIEFFVGESDNVTLNNFETVTSAMNITSAEQFLDTNKVKEFQDTLRTRSFAFQRILSQILTADDLSPDSITPASAFMLLGQRFIIDSYITGQVVYDKIKFNNTKIRRMLPSTLDVLFALGNDAAAQLLKDELDQYKYGSNLAALRYLVDHYESEFWNSSLFNLWLAVIRTLNPPVNRDSLPPFMQTAAWWQEKINTQLASWTELRHDNLLYAKQSYTGGAVCSFPYTYVEPNPYFYNAVKRFAEKARTKIQTFSFPYSYTRDIIVSYYNNMYSVMDTLETIAINELSSTPFSEHELSFLRRVLTSEFGCVPTYGGWYPQLFYGEEGQGGVFCKKDYLVADVHTAPTDAAGYPVGWVLHAGTGKINTGLFIATQPVGRVTAFVGPVSSYHEYLSTNFLRLSDEEWIYSYLLQSNRPPFVNLYLADSTGSKLPTGTNLFTSVNNNSTPNLPQYANLKPCYPNPFNSSTIINFSIPSSMTNSVIELTIYNINGQIVKSLLKETLPSGNYLMRWDATDDRGRIVPTGTYFYKLKIGENLLSGKVNFIK
ncbi:MAG: DUF3160 domain-containing protein [Ignavibacteriales bacterium]|nr:DUF3160 domain-containing protein [Ignavibacteriales bacterium]